MSTTPPYQARARAICASASSSSAVQTLSATSACSRRVPSVRDSTSSDAPYMGDVSKSVAPAAKAASSTARHPASAAAPRTSKVRQVPIPTTGTSSPVVPRGRRCMPGSRARRRPPWAPTPPRRYFPSMLVVRDDTEKAIQYAIMRRRATALLAAFAVLFAATTVVAHLRPDLAPFWLGLLRATSEAAMVGGIADWFAVTALFRHPLGLPIPHTAIVARRKDRIGRSLGNFVGNNFLSREVITRQLAGMQLGERAARWLAEPEHQARVARAIATGVARAAEAIPGEDLQASVHETLVAQLHKAHVAPLLGDLLALVTTDDRHQEMLDRLVTLVNRIVEDNKEIIRLRIAEESPWWIPGAVDDKLYQKIVSGIERTLADVAADDAHPLRSQFDKALRDWVEKLHSSPVTIARAESMKERLLEHPAVTELSGALLGAGRQALAKYAGPEAPTPEPLERALGALAERALGNETLLHDVDDSVERLVLGVVDQYRPEVAGLIARTVEGWDATAASEKIEIQVGRDLQFIRINGTLVGALVGLLLYLVTVLVG